MVQRIQPGQYVGMLGDGQLGRMFCHAAQALGYKVVVLGQDAQGPAAQVAEQHICADYLDEQALKKMVSLTQAVTTEFENVPAQTLMQLGQHILTAPNGQAVSIVQDRCQEKAFITAQGIDVAPYAQILSLNDLQNASDDLFPAILKVARLGYDGKGQARVQNREQAIQAFQDFGQTPCVLEKRLALKYEISMVLARGLDGEIKTYPVGVNRHIDGILSTTLVQPDLVPHAIQAKASDYAHRLAQALQYVGVFCVEFFVLEDDRLVVNEIAPRPHNSGHYTIDACVTSQFEQQLRAMAGMPLGDTHLLAPAMMLNILGDSWFVNGHEQEPDWASVLALPGVSLHLYGKAQARKGRKMGHVTVVHADRTRLMVLAQQVSDLLYLHADVSCTI